MRFFRVQSKGYKFSDMVDHNSADGGDGNEAGLAVSGRPDGLDGGGRFGGAWDAMDDNDDIVIVEGIIVSEIYDGYRIIPEKEIARFTIGQWKSMLADETAWDLED